MKVCECLASSFASFLVILITDTPEMDSSLHPPVVTDAVDERKCCCFQKHFHLLEQKDIQVKELEKELKEARRTVSQLVENQNLAEVIQNMEERLKDKVEKTAREFMGRMEERLEEHVQKILMEAMKEGKKDKQTSEKAEEDPEKKKKELDGNLTTEEKTDIVAGNVSSSSFSGENGDEKSSLDGLSKEIGSLESLRLKVDSVLSDGLQVLKGRILLEDSQIFFTNSWIPKLKSTPLNFVEFERIVRQYQASNSMKCEHLLSVIWNPLWILAPQNYKVECLACTRKYPLNHSNIREDGIAVCPHTGALTTLGIPMKNTTWAIVDPCRHFQQVRKGEKMEECLVCGEKITELRELCMYISPRRIKK